MPRSKFDKETIREYFEHCQRTGIKRINSISALVEHAYKNGNNDAEIKTWLFPEDGAPTITCPTCNGAGRIPEPPARREPDPACQLCLGTGMEVVPGKGARRCACRKLAETAKAA